MNSHANRGGQRSNGRYARDDIGAGSLVERLTDVCETITPDMVAGLREAASLVDADGRRDLGVILRKCAESVETLLEIKTALPDKGVESCGELWLG
ncbi:MAG: hypothetical protein GX552_12115 [Chloroflexi bacterium]|jgi:hypothetical protein|nr:hypothetical protein [Chloroflexota bacterium]